ncbi:MAG: ABC transporter transmembrane domain-containing protein [Flavobacteriaceae bacterium]|nr:ABC transporter transmembrane domain-containing protein [Flavobacteriaceae bacterium]
MTFNYKKYLVYQHDQKDCGCACLRMALKYYGGDTNLEFLKEISGTNTRGTSILGLIQASKKIGLLAEAFKASIPEIKSIAKPYILHVEKGDFFHYVLCFGFDNKKKRFIIADPAVGLQMYSENELLKIWTHGYVLILRKNPKTQLARTTKRKSFNWVLEMIKADSSYYIAAVFLGIVLALLNMTSLIITEKLIDIVLPSRNLVLLYKTIIIWIFLLLITILLSYLRSLILIKQAQIFNVRVFRYFFQRLLNKPISFFESKKKGDMIARLNDTERIQKNIKTIIADSLIEIFTILIAFIFLFHYSPMVALIGLLSIPVFYLCTSLFNTKIKKLQQKMFISYAATESNYIDTIDGIETIKVYKKEKNHFEKNYFSYSSLQKSIFNLVKYDIQQASILDLYSILISSSASTYALFLVFNQEIKVGDLIAILALINMITSAVLNTVQLNFEVFESKIAIDRMFDFSQRSDECYNDKEQIKSIQCINSITIENLAFSYPGQNNLIECANLKLTKGNITFLQGKSGSGKSTLSRLLLKFYQPKKGKITINHNTALKDLNTSFWLDQIAYVPQNIKIFNHSILYNIALDENISEYEIIQFCENSLKLRGFFHNFQDSYWTVLGEEGVTPSGGEKQIISIARAIFSKPKVLILDEATSSMDKEIQNKIMNLLNQLKNEILILFITHNEKQFNYNPNFNFILKDKIISKNTT